MKKELKKLVEEEGVKAPQSCTISLKKNFSDANNIEWQQINTVYEAIFYKDNLEFIALFKSDGELIEYRRVVPEGYLPFAIRKSILEKGEIMNRVLLNRGNELLYEVIYRDKNLKRFMLLINDLGKVITHKKL